MKRCTNKDDWYTYSKNAILIFCFLFHIQPGVCQEKSPTENQETEKTTVESISDENQKWLTYVNSKSDLLDEIYAENAIKILENDQVIQGSTAIKKYLFAQNTMLQSIQTEAIVMANTRRKIEYELGSYTDKNGNTYVQIIIWQTGDSKRQRVLEFEALSDNNLSIPVDITMRRDQWIELCNAHNAAALINEMYSENTLYYNHKPILRGRDQVIVDYQYMNNEKYSLNLTPIHTKSVNQNFVFEIGQCSGSYNGKYIIIWKKNKENKWEVYLDSNI